MSAPVSDWFEQRRRQLESVLAQFLNAYGGRQNMLDEASSHAVLDGGKRLRPLLVFASGEISQADDAVLVRLAAAVELLHCYSLVHDDLPAMDNDDWRRGKPTVHKKYNEAIAILVGDSLQVVAFDVVLTTSALSDRSCREILQTLAHAVGPRGMVYGQAQDVLYCGKPISYAALEDMHRHKTGALIHASVMLGVLAGELDTETHLILDQIGQTLGLAYQVIDDILDVTASSEQLGKTAGKDKRHAKPSYTSVLGLEWAKHVATTLHEKILQLLDSLPQRHHAYSQNLRALAELMYQRVY